MPLIISAPASGLGPLQILVKSVVVVGTLTAALASMLLALLAVASWTPRTAVWLQALGLLLAIPLTGAAAYLAAVWSQSWLLVLDRRAYFFDALPESAAITRGHASCCSGGPAHFLPSPPRLWSGRPTGAPKRRP